MFTDLGTAMFRAPEVITQSYSFKCDIWSAGVMLYMMLSGNCPFDADTIEEVDQKIINKTFDFSESEFKYISAEGKDLLSKILTEEDKRPSAKKVLQHPWFEKFKDCESPNLITPRLLKRLEKYRWSATFRKIVQFYISVQKLDENQEIVSIFKEIDTNNDGYITPKELERGLCQMKINNTIGKLAWLSYFRCQETC